MADPRNAVSYAGILPVRVTFKHDSTIVYSATAVNGAAQVGLAVTITADDTVGLVDTDQYVLGELVSVEPGGVCTVQIGGVVDLPAGNAATVTAGAQIVGAQGASSAKGYIKSVAAASASPTQAEVNNLANARGRILNNDTTTKVVVLL